MPTSRGIASTFDCNVVQQAAAWFPLVMTVSAVLELMPLNDTIKHVGDGKLGLALLICELATWSLSPLIGLFRLLAPL